MNTAVNEMGRVVQQNAASAEENASASEEMNAQAEQMKSYVGDLVRQVESDGRESKAVIMTAGDKPTVFRTRQVMPERMLPRSTMGIRQCPSPPANGP